MCVRTRRGEPATAKIRGSSQTDPSTHRHVSKHLLDYLLLARFHGLMVVRKPTLRVVGVQTRCSPPSCFSVDKSQPHAELCRPRDDLALRGRTTRPWDRNCVWPPLCIRVVARDAPPYAAAYPYACAAGSSSGTGSCHFCLVVRHFLPSCASLFA